MKVVYLSNGQMCYLKEQIGSKFIVSKIYEYEDEESGLQEIESLNDIVVDAIYLKKPIEKIDAEIKQLQELKLQEQENVRKLQQEVRALKRDVSEIEKTQINNNKFIVNRSEIINAKTIVLFPKDKIAPFALDCKDYGFRGLKISMELSIVDGKERYWGYKLYHDYMPYGDYLCEKYGFLINPTDEEINETVIKRLSEFKFSEWTIKQTPDKYLTPELLSQKKYILDAERIKDISNLEKTLIETKDKLSKLQSLF